MKFKNPKISALAIVLAISLTTFAFPLTASAKEEQQTYTYKTYEGKSSGKVKVTDAYKKTYAKNMYGCTAKVRIPKVTISGVNTKDINNKIYKYCKKNSGNECSCNYSYYVGKTYVSLKITFQEEHDMSPATIYTIYNISRKTGKQLSRSEMLKALNLTSSKFEARVKKSLNKMANSQMYYGQYDMMNRNLQKEKMKKVIPYVNNKGKVSYLYKLLEVPAGAGNYDHCGTC